MQTGIALKNITSRNYFEYAFLSIIILIAAYFRLKGLGIWPLAVDEYYLVKSAENILNYGLPRTAGGGYYNRGLLLQYIVAGLMVSGIKAEFAARIIPVVTNIITILPLYLLVKKISNRLLAATIIIIFCFSLWEVEFARFARMYAPFQMIFIFYIYFLYKYMIGNERKAVIWVFILSFLSILVHEEGLFIVLLNFLILFRSPEQKYLSFLNFWTNKKRLIYFSICTGIFGLYYLYYNYNLLNSMGGTKPEPYPEGFLETYGHLYKSHYIRKPFLQFLTIPDNILWIIPLSIVFIINLSGLLKIFKTSFLSLDNKACIFIIFLLSFTHQFGLLLLILLILLAADLIDINNLRKKEFRIVPLTVVLNFIFWFTYSFFTSGWHAYILKFDTGSAKAIIKKIFFLLFNYPDNYNQVYNYAVVVPVISLLFILSLGVLTYYIIRTDYYRSEGFRFIMVILLLMIISVSMIATVLNETRYTFFLYPIILLVILLTFNLISDFIFKKKIISKISFVIIASVFFIASGDISLKHLMNIDKKEYNFRMVYGREKIKHYYPRWDIRTPGEFVNRNSQKDDIIIANELRGEISPAIEHYLDRLDYIYSRSDHWYFFIISSNRGKNERWTNAGFIFNTQKLKEIIENASNNVWFITAANTPLKEIVFKKKLNEYIDYTSVDERVLVYKIPGGSTITKN